EKMDGKNSSGRRVSLLNDNIEAPHLVRLPSITPSLRSRTSSYASSPIGSPPTPRLVRSDSSDSVTMQTPSPTTPEFGFDTMSQGLASPDYAQQQYFDMQDNMPHNPMPPQQPQPKYYPQPTMPYHQQHQQQGFYGQPPMPEQHVAGPAPAPAPASARPKKNSYPCPMAKQYHCTDYFTTSGHAARHAKKHTGKKDAYCPECNKAFTRKDNMEQHRRTHQSGRSAKASSENGVKKLSAKAAGKRPRPSPLQSSAPSMSLPNLDPSLSVSPDTANFLAPAVQQVEPLMDYPMQQQRSAYPDPTQYSMSGYSASGLDALAIAASGEERTWDQ
ncbi:hypothetical protein EJ07DRAFT_97336, partial [Lizonia empirigonia]